MTHLDARSPFMSQIKEGIVGGSAIKGFLKANPFMTLS